MLSSSSERCGRAGRQVLQKNHETLVVRLQNLGQRLFPVSAAAAWGWHPAHAGVHQLQDAGNPFNRFLVLA